MTRNWYQGAILMNWQKKYWFIGWCSYFILCNSFVKIGFILDAISFYRFYIQKLKFAIFFLWIILSYIYIHICVCVSPYIFPKSMAKFFFQTLSIRITLAFSLSWLLRCTFKQFSSKTDKRELMCISVFLVLCHNYFSHSGLSAYRQLDALCTLN